MKNKKGMTLLEMLCVVLIVLMVSTGLARGISLAQEQYMYSITRSQAQELYTTLETILTNELHYTTQVSCTNDNKVKTFYSVTYAIHSAQTELFVLDPDVDGFGELALGVDEEYNRLLSSASYPNGLRVNVVEFIYKPAQKCFSLTLHVGRNGETLAGGTFEVQTLNDVTINY